ncbi:hypothetical protein MgSA37_02833 [Mucilaginibacter gotjawali]|uniref:Uncharacterized protein n=1 Tax=Mucilaginibacter gotjawali TaxID=1550579 RepID=A0A110B305_9SPHI|nr:hypothetical protein [Mucilaginibacter gotjawali]BAU54655.1 hypothetical protein MgSA37_02833 [Mucilaginibacter gotjawali]
MSVNVNEGGLNYTASIDDTDLNTRLKTIETNILATGKASVTASDMQVKSIMQLKIQLQSYQAIAEKSTDPARLILYNQKIQDLQIQIQKLGRAGKEGFDSMGNAIEKIAPAVAAVVPQIKEVEVEVEAVTQKVGKFQNAINRATDVQVIGARVVSMFSRQIIGLGVGMLSVTIGAKAIEALAKWVENLRIFNPLASEAKLALEELNKAYASSDYTTAIKNINELTINIDLAKKGFLDKTKVLKEYNTTLGSSIGYADNLNQAEQDIVKNGNAFIKITLLKAVAQLALSDAAKKTYEAQLIAANPPTPFGGKNNNGSFQGNAPAAIKKYYADLNKGQADAEKQKISDLNDQANKFSAIAKKSQQAAADLAKATGIDFFDGTQDPVKTPKVKTDPSVKAGETLVASYKTAFEKLDALKQEYASKEKTKDQQEIDAIKAKFKLETDSLIKLNEARDKFIRNYNKAHAGGGGAAYADKIGAKYIDPSTLDPIQANALSDLAGSQAVEKLKPQVEQMKSLFNEYQAFKLKVGTETADKLYGNELGGFKTYLAYLKSLQPTEAQLNSTDPTIKATASKTKDFLTPLTASASISETVQNQKNLATLLEQNETYEARRKQLIEKANDELVTALKAGYVDQAGVIYTALTAQLKVEDIGQEQKVEAAKKLTETIINETKEQAKITLDAANAKMNQRKHTDKFQLIPTIR